MQDSTRHLVEIPLPMLPTLGILAQHVFGGPVFPLQESSMLAALAGSFQLTEYSSSLLWISSLSIAVFVLSSFAYMRLKKELKLNAFTFTSIYWGLVVAVLLIDTIGYMFAYEEQLPAILAGMGGAALGWLFGMWLSPLGNTESTKFSRYWTVVGVGSGFSLKWLLDHVAAHKADIVQNWKPAAIGTVSCLITAATVYNSRAYDAALNIFPRREPGGPAPSSTTPFSIASGKKQAFYAQVTGPSDPLCHWEVIPYTLGEVDSEGLFTAKGPKGVGKLVACNLEDSTLSNSFDIEVVEASTFNAQLATPATGE